MTRRRPAIVAGAVLAAGLTVAIAPAAGVQHARATTPQKATNGRIAFVLTPIAGKCSGAAGNLATANPDGSGCRVLTNGEEVSTPRSSPDANEIAFVNVVNLVSTVSVIDADGTNERQLVSGPGNASEPAWSPDGKQIAFTSDQTGTPEIYVADAGTGAVVAQLTSGAPASFQPAWSPDGSEIAFVSNRNGHDQVFLMAADGTNQHILRNDAGTSISPAWSPDGRRIAYASDRLTRGRFQIYVTSAVGSGTSRVVSDHSDDQQPSWSPDGRLIAFTRDAGAEGSVSVADVSKHSSTGLPQYPGEQPSWARLPLPTGSVPGVTVDATPHGAVQVQPGGSRLSVPLNGPAGVPVVSNGATIFTPAHGASVRLNTKLADGRAAVITISEGSFAISQPDHGSATRIELIGEPMAKCPPKQGAHVALIPAMPNWGIHSRGNGHPKVVHGRVTLGFHGTDVRVVDECRVGHGIDQLKVMTITGSVAVRVGHRLLMVLHGGHGRFHTRGPHSAATVRG